MAHLFSTLSIAGKTLRNRVVLAPSASGYAALDGFVGEALYSYYLDRAHGGVGLIIIEPAHVLNPSSRDTRGHLGIYHDSFVPRLRSLATAIQGGGACVLLSLEASAGLASRSEATLHEVAEAFIQAAWRARLAGFDGINLSSADGGILHSLISPLANRRTDGYGGSPDNRMRLAVEIIEGIRQWLGHRFIIGFRLVAEEFDPRGMKLQDARVIARRLTATGVNIIDVTTDMRTDIHVAHFPGWRVPLAASIKSVLPDVPVIGSGLLGDPHLADSVVRDGSIDLVMLGRSLRTNPYWTQLARIVLDSQPELVALNY